MPLLEGIKLFLGACCLLLVAFWLAACRLLLAACCLLFAACCHSVFCLLSDVCWLKLFAASYLNLYLPAAPCMHIPLHVLRREHRRSEVEVGGSASNEDPATLVTAIRVQKQSIAERNR